MFPGSQRGLAAAVFWSIWLAASVDVLAAQQRRGPPPPIPPDPPPTGSWIEGSPEWLKTGLELRGRLERKMGLKYTPGADDTYYVHRLRLDFDIQPNGWLRLFAQAQDSQAPGFSRRPTPAVFENTLDFRQGYVELGRTESGSWGLRVGRQDLRLGEARLIGPSNWSNSSRSWDAARLTLRRPGVRLDWFAGALVIIGSGRFDRPQLRNGLYAFYSTFDRFFPDMVLEPYFFWRTNSSVRSESGAAGDLDRYTCGARWTGPLPLGLDHGVEAAFQAGHHARDTIRAWAGHWAVGRTFYARAWVPRLAFEYNHASGDNNPTDGRRGTFDQLFPSNHDKYGTADRITLRNINDVTAGLEVTPTRRWKCRFDLHYFWLATTQDGMYTDGGALIALNRRASSRRVGPETDLQFWYNFSERLLLGFGYAHLFAGPYLRQTIRETGSTYPYVMFTYRM